MLPAPLTVSLEITPTARFDVINVNDRTKTIERDLQRFPQALYCSYHTTAGYLDQGLVSRLQGLMGIYPYMQIFQTIFPKDAGYHHDELDQRHDLSEGQRAVEPRNGDAHLAFIAAGMSNCVRYTIRPRRPQIYFIDLDGMNGGRARRRFSSIIAFNVEEVVARERFEVPVSSDAVDSVNLKDPGLGLYPQLHRLITHHGVTTGRIHLRLPTNEQHAGLTINEHETLLMRHDLFGVLQDPLRFMADKRRYMLVDDWAMSSNVVDSPRYDMRQILNDVFDTFGMNQSRAKKVLAQTITVPNGRFFLMKRSISLLVFESGLSGQPTVVGGPYQSPILVQWDKTTTQRRIIEITLTRIS